MLAILFAGLLSPVTRADVQISYETPAKPLGRVLEELGPKIGKDLRCEAHLRSAPIVASVRDVPADQLLEKVATVVGGEWRDEKDYLLLFQTSEAVLAEEKASFEARVQAIRAVLADDFKNLDLSFGKGEAEGLAQNIAVLREQMASDPDNPGYRAAYDARFMHAPLKRALVRLVKTIPPEEIARAGVRTVFALHPTPKQHPFGPGADAVLKVLAEEQALWVQAWGRFDPRGEKQIQSPIELRPTWEEVPQDGEIWVVVTQYRPGALGISLVIGKRGSSEAGKTAAQWSPRFYRVPGAPDRGEGEGAPIPVVLTELSRELAVQTGNIFGGNDPVFLSKELRAQLLDPVGHDPLELVVSDCVLAIGRARAKPLVAWVSDKLLWTLIGAARKPGLDSERVERLLMGDPIGMRLVERDGWLVGRPADPADARSSQTDREALRTFARAIDAAGGVRLRDLARFAVTVNGSQLNHLGFFAMQLLDPVSSTVLSVSDWAGLRVYGALSDPQVQSLAEGRSVRFDQAPPQLQRLMEEMAFSREIDNAEWISPTDFTSRSARFEPTIALAAGLPGDARLFARDEPRSAVFVFGKRGESAAPLNMVTPTTIAMYERPQSPLSIGGLPAAGYAVGEVGLLRLRLAFSPDMWHEVKMVDYRIGASVVPVPWTELPESIVSAVRAALGRQAPPPRQ